MFFFSAGSYTDFKTIFNALEDNKGNVFYFVDPSNNFAALFVPYKNAQGVFLTAGASVNSAGSGAGGPGSFATDFPNAISVSPHVGFTALSITSLD